MTPERANAIKAYVDALRAYERAPTIRNYSRVMDAIEEIRRVRRLLNDDSDWTEYDARMENPDAFPSCANAD